MLGSCRWVCWLHYQLCNNATSFSTELYSNLVIKRARAHMPCQIEMSDVTGSNQENVCKQMQLQLLSFRKLTELTWNPPAVRALIIKSGRRATPAAYVSKGEGTVPTLSTAVKEIHKQHSHLCWQEYFEQAQRFPADMSPKGFHKVSQIHCLKGWAPSMHQKTKDIGCKPKVLSFPGTTNQCGC